MEPIEWLGDRIRMVDQTKLPLELVYIETADYLEVANAIRTLQVRGAPAIGVAAAYGIVLGALGICENEQSLFHRELEAIYCVFASTRPTAVNLFKTVQRMRAVACEKDAVSTKKALQSEAARIHKDEEIATECLGRLGADLVDRDFVILTHCNAGALATTGYGTALGVIAAAHRQGKQISVFATETRPLLQGARLTAWELMQENIPVTLITDSMVGHFLKQGKIDCVIVGADRIAANGDVANKIGTYTIAVLANENNVPFYVAAPLSTIDLSLPCGSAIPIEERNPEEVTSIQGNRIAPEGVSVANPSFDVTPHNYVKAIITEKGVAREPYSQNLATFFDGVL
ncbi:MAG: S-methyl-5-thioribose-1-phosphate isomerase [Chloroflexota bacterium]|nr:S-methyl-5-thioribose-1-phosphate isomerase [Chloroflexota bacterium]